jgi:hypothetical protein
MARDRPQMPASTFGVGVNNGHFPCWFRIVVHFVGLFPLSDPVFSVKRVDVFFVGSRHSKSL